MHASTAKADHFTSSVAMHIDTFCCLFFSISLINTSRYSAYILWPTDECGGVWKVTTLWGGYLCIRFQSTNGSLLNWPSGEGCACIPGCVVTLSPGPALVFCFNIPDLADSGSAFPHPGLYLTAGSNSPPPTPLLRAGQLSLAFGLAVLRL